MRRILAVVAAAGALLIVALLARPDGAAGRAEGRAGYRRAQRAYAGAPPVIPHAVRALQRQDCLACHAEGIDLGEDGLAPRTPHPQQTQCAQCHVEQPGRGDGLAASLFEGWREPERGTRAYPGAPPTVPHRLHTRSNCLGCHGELGGSPIRTPHPDRVNCRQCHVEARPETAPWRINTFAGGAR